MTTYTNTVQDDLTVGDLPHVRWILSNTDNLGVALVISDDVSLAVATTPEDSLTIGDEVITPWVNNPVDALTIGDAVSISSQVDRVRDALKIRDSSIQIVPVYVVDALTAGDLTRIAIAHHVVDSLTIADESVTTQTFANRVADALTVTDALRVAYRFKVTDALTIGDELELKRGTVALLVDNLVMAEEAAVLNPTTCRVADTITIGEDLSVVLSAINKVEDSLVIEDAALGGGPGSAWRAHAELMAMSRYTNFPFTSMATVGGYLLATSPSGLCRLDGTTDGGVNIDATVQHDLSDEVMNDDGKMATDPNFKRPRYAYAAYKSGGVLRLRLGYVDASGNELSADFDMPARAANQYLNGRIDLGRGIRSRYLRPTLLNVDGAPFGMNELKLVVDSVKRKI
jgi:hypothetical protein